jgi:hypothetical protein
MPVEDRVTVGGGGGLAFFCCEAAGWSPLCWAAATSAVAMNRVQNSKRMGISFEGHF